MNQGPRAQESKLPKAQAHLPSQQFLNPDAPADVEFRVLGA